VLDLGLLSPEQLAVMPKERLCDLIFEPGFSTAAKVSELSGRGIGLDVVRSQLRSLKGTVTVSSTPGEGTTFTLRLPLTLTIAKLLVCLVGSTAISMPSDSVEEIVIPQATQIKTSGNQRFLHWQRQIIPVYRVSELLDYNCPLSETFPSKALAPVPSPEDWAIPLLLLRRGQQLFALEVERLVTEQELVIKPFGSAIASPIYTYGCTILGDGGLIPVINGGILLDQFLEPGTTLSSSAGNINSESINSEQQNTRGALHATTVLVVDDSVTLRKTLALTLQKAGYRVLQAKDGRDALEQLQQSKIDLVICDIEMPTMNGFEFLSQRRLEPQFLQIPVAMLTSRSSEKHRKLAMQLGASAYFTKPYIEQQFLDAIISLLRQNSKTQVLV
jgi:chemotaxis family two-component system sensor histidine kinase/response regulator PixL